MKRPPLQVTLAFFARAHRVTVKGENYSGNAMLSSFSRQKKTPQKRGFFTLGAVDLHHAAHAAHAAHVGHCRCSRLIFNDLSHHTLSGDHQSCD